MVGLGQREVVFVLDRPSLPAESRRAYPIRRPLPIEAQVNERRTDAIQVPDHQLAVGCPGGQPVLSGDPGQAPDAVAALGQVEAGRACARSQIVMARFASASQSPPAPSAIVELEALAGSPPKVVVFCPVAVSQTSISYRRLMLTSRCPSGPNARWRAPPG